MKIRSSMNDTPINRDRFRKRHEVVKALKAARKRFKKDEEVRPSFEVDLTLMFIRNRLSAIFAMPLFVVVVAAISSIWIKIAWVSVWLLFALSIHLLVYISTHQLEKAVEASPNLRNVRRELLLGEALYGLSWSSFFLLNIAHTPTEGFEVFQFATMLIVIAMAAMLSAPMPNALILGTVPITFTLIYCFMTYATPIHYAMAAMAVGAQGFFLILSRQVHASALTMLEYRAEKDDLIVELEQLNAISLESRRRAEEANLAKSRFLAAVSHELRTPLNAILGFSEVMKDELLGKIGNQRYAEYSNDIHSSGQHLLNLINEILDLSRIEAGRYELHEEAVSLAEISDQCTQMLTMRAAYKSIDLHEEHEASLPKVWADSRAIRQIILNLLTNAIKFTPKRGEVRVSVGSTVTGGQFISIKDNGPGIPEKEMPTVLQAFGQGSQAIKSAEQGTGLGFSIVQALTVMHDGEFHISSTPHCGTTVTISLPAKRILKSNQTLDESPYHASQPRDDLKSYPSQ
ncbi:sensor histidine kinase [Flexibacterium corallicola]|uniref:sensor histidine kinase n=1 Tax=Flexibacterium corallicola TaxID=3037259 RepID=UPI00286F3DED|nr:HAMP domain-containing sensor histidine kinase [Pseudovibrio sp. M1P-2-3]